jgi:hypothetical protein
MVVPVCGSADDEEGPPTAGLRVLARCPQAFRSMPAAVCDWILSVGLDEGEARALGASWLYVQRTALIREVGSTLGR